MAPPAPPFVPPLAASVALPACELSRNLVTPPPASVAVPPFAVMTAVPAVESPLKVTPPPSALLRAPPLEVKVALPAVELSAKDTLPPREESYGKRKLMIAVGAGSTGGPDCQTVWLPPL